MKQKKDFSEILYSIITALVMVMISGIMLILIVWGFFTAFKTDFEFMTNKVSFPRKWTVDNFIIVFLRMSHSVDGGTREVFMEEMLLNTLLYAVGSAFFATLIPCMVAYVTVRFPIKFSKIITSFVLIAMILPIVGNLPSEIQMAKALGLYDKIWGLWIMKANFLGLYFLVFQSAFKKIPKALIEAATSDGAGHFLIFRKIALPLVRTTFSLVFLLKFVDFWNDYQTPLIYLPNHPTISQGLYHFNFSTDNMLATVPVKIAGAMYVLLPILLIFIIFRNKLMGDLTIGGLKE